MRVVKHGDPRLIRPPEIHIRKSILPIPYTCVECSTELEVDFISDIALHHRQFWYEKEGKRKAAVTCPMEGCGHITFLNSPSFVGTGLTMKDIEYIEDYLLDLERDSARDIARDAYVGVLKTIGRVLSAREQGRRTTSSAWTLIAVTVVTFLMIVTIM